MANYLKLSSSNKLFVRSWPLDNKCLSTIVGFGHVVHLADTTIGRRRRHLLCKFVKDSCRRHPFVSFQWIWSTRFQLMLVVCAPNKCICSIVVAVVLLKCWFSSLGHWPSLKVDFRGLCVTFVVLPPVAPILHGVVPGIRSPMLGKQVNSGWIVCHLNEKDVNL